MPPDIEPNTILVVDDDPRVLHLIGMNLKFSNLTGKTTDDPHEALVVYAGNAPNIPVVVTDRDYKLQEIDGEGFSKRIREIATKHQPSLNVRIIMVTADYLTPEIIGRLKSSGVDEIIPKPFSPANLTQRIKAGIDQFRVSS